MSANIIKSETITFPIADVINAIEYKAHDMNLEIANIDGVFEQLGYGIAEQAMFSTVDEGFNDFLEYLATTVSNNHSADNRKEDILYEDVYSLSTELNNVYTKCISILNDNDRYSFMKHIDYLSDICFTRNDDMSIEGVMSISEGKLIVYGDYSHELLVMSQLIMSDNSIDNINATSIARDLLTLCVYRLDNLSNTSFNYAFYDEIIKDYSRSVDGAVHNGMGPTYFMLNACDLHLFQLVEEVMTDLVSKSGISKINNKKFLNGDDATYKVILECIEYKEC